MGFKSGDYLVLYEVHNNLLSGCLGGYGLYPLGELVHSSDNPTKPIAGVVFEFSNEIKPPLLKGSKDYYRCKGKSNQLLLPREELILLETLNMSMHICKDGQPIVTNSKDFVGSCFATKWPPQNPE